MKVIGNMDLSLCNQWPNMIKPKALCNYKSHSWWLILLAICQLFEPEIAILNDSLDEETPVAILLFTNLSKGRKSSSLPLLASYWTLFYEIWGHTLASIQVIIWLTYNDPQGLTGQQY